MTDTVGGAFLRAIREDPSLLAQKEETVTEPNTIDEATTARILRLAAAEGEDAGKAAGSWVLDGNSTQETIREFIRMDEEGDPFLANYLPSAPFSGEWAGSPEPGEVVLAVAEELHEYDEDGTGAYDGLAVPTWLYDAILDAYEQAYETAARDEVMRMAHAMLDNEDNES